MGWHGANGSAGGSGAHAHPRRSRLPSPATLLGTAFLLFMGSQLLTTSPFGDLVEVPLPGPAMLTRYGPARGSSDGSRPSIGDGPDIHGYLQPAFAGMDPAMFVANISRWYDEAVRQVGPAGGQGGRSTCTAISHTLLRRQTACTAENSYCMDLPLLAGRPVLMQQQLCVRRVPGPSWG